MARIYQPLKRKGDGRWDMTVGSDDEGWTHAIGYCHAYRELKPMEGFSQEQTDRENAKIAPFRAKYHDTGHDSAEQAEACYREYVLDQEVRFSRTTSAERCLECQEWTPEMVEVGPFRFLRLCAKHQAADLIRKHFDTR